MAQLYNSSHLRHYDYGKNENLKIYGEEEPPNYNLKNVSVPVTIFSSDGDELCPTKVSKNDFGKMT